jgi:hypothetical protein
MTQLCPFFRVFLFLFLWGAPALKTEPLLLVKGCFQFHLAHVLKLNESRYLHLDASR